MRHTALTRWIKAADARGSGPQTRSNLPKNRHHLKNALRAVVIGVPVTLAFIGGASVISAFSGNPPRLDCSGFPAVTCHPAAHPSMS